MLLDEIFCIVTNLFEMMLQQTKNILCGWSNF